MILSRPSPANNPPGRGLFHGWKIVGLSLLTQALQAGILIYAFGTLALAMEAAFATTRAEVMLSATVLALSANLLSPWFGSLVDRYPLRRLMLIGISCLSIGLIAVAASQNLWQAWLAFATLLAAGNLLLGQLPTAALITRWFDRLRGRALGVAAVGTSLGGFLLPILLALLIEALGWRLALIALAVGAWLLTAPLIAKLVVDRPRDLALSPDGGTGDAAVAKAAAPPSGDIRWILSRPLFWWLTIAVGIALFVYTGLLSNLYPHAVNLGLPTARAGALMSLLAACSIVGKLGFGGLADRVDLRLTMATSFLLMIVGALLLGQSAAAPGLLAGVVLFGLAAGGLLPVWGALVARGFGQRSFGRALGCMNLAMTPITLLSAPYAGYLFDRYGSYSPAFLSYCGILTLGLLALAALRLPPHREQ